MEIIDDLITYKEKQIEIDKCAVGASSDPALEKFVKRLKENADFVKRLKEYDERGAAGDGITDDTKAVTECYENADSVRPTPRELLNKPRQG